MLRKTPNSVALHSMHIKKTTIHIKSGFYTLLLIKNSFTSNGRSLGTYPIIFWAANISGVCPLQSGPSTSWEQRSNVWRKTLNAESHQEQQANLIKINLEMPHSDKKARLLQQKNVIMGVWPVPLPWDKLLWPCAGRGWRGEVPGNLPHLQWMGLLHIWWAGWPWGGDPVCSHTPSIVL